MRLAAYTGHGSGERYSKYEHLFQHDDGTGLYTLPAVMQFVKFLIDVSQQTSLNEFQIFPACFVTMSVDEIERSLTEGTMDEARSRLLHVVGTELSKITRQADRAARFDRNFALLLTRTMARNVRDDYAPRVAEFLARVSQEAGTQTTFCFGITSLTEHLIVDTDDVLRKSLRALQAAQDSEPGAVAIGPAAVAIYDLRTMPLDNSRS